MYPFGSSLRLLLICVLVSGCLVACARPQPKREAALRVAPYTLAIFPWNLTDHLQAESYSYGIAALKKALAGSAFAPRYSYYRFRDAERMTSTDVPGIEELWAGGSFTTGPPLDRVLQLGASLAVDAVLVYAMYARPGPDEMWVHLYDITNHKHYVADGGVESYHANVVTELHRMTRHVFEAFVSHRELSTVK